MNEYPKVSEGILGEEDTAKTNTEKFLELVGQYFPEAIKDGEVDFTALKEEMGEFAEVGSEHYDFTWAGKQAAKKEALSDIFGRTLKYKPEDSLNPDTTENLYIEGDNLEALKLLRRNYHGKIKMIYIDPPYNTGNDFVYRDNSTMTEEDLAELSGDTVNGERLQKNPKDGSRFHTNWLNMMYPRLKIARELLTDDGVIFISIDENEVSTLKNICDQIFGENNFIAELIWTAGRKNDSKHISVSHEYILCFFKNFEYISEHKITWRERKQGLDDIYGKYESLKRQYGADCETIEKELKSWYSNLPDGHPAKDHAHYSKVDERGIFFADNISWPGGGGPKYDVLHPVTGKPVKIPSRGWLTNEETMKEWIRLGKVSFGKDESAVPTLKSYLKDREYSVPYSVFYKDGRASSKRLAALLGDKVFENPKDEEIISRIINFCGMTDGDVILDFFSGSATTAHSVFLSNISNNKKIKFILVQVPEEVDPNKTANAKSKKVAQNAVNFLDSISKPHTICEIGKERIRRAAKKIHEENPDAVFDDGFKVFTVSDTNIRWNNMSDEEIKQLTEVNYNETDIDFTPGYNDIDVVYEIMLGQYDIPLSTPIEKLADISERTYIFADAVVVCLEPEITDSLVEKLAAIEPLPAKYVFRDSAFGSDIAFKDDTFRKLSGLIANHQIEEERKSKFNNYTVEFI